MMLSATIILSQLLSNLTLQEEKVSIWEAKYNHEKALLAVPGVKRISIGGIGDNYHIVISVDSWMTGEKVKKITGGKIEGWPIHISISRSKGRSKTGNRVAAPKCTHCPVHCAKGKRGGTTVVHPREINPPRPEELCDIARKLFGKPRRTDAKESSICTQMVGWTNDRKRMEWVKKNNLPQWLPGEMGKQLDAQGNPVFIAYTYIKHRRACPMYRQTVMPSVDRLTPTRPVSRLPTGNER